MSDQHRIHARSAPDFIERFKAVCLIAAPVVDKRHLAATDAVSDDNRCRSPGLSRAVQRHGDQCNPTHMPPAGSWLAANVHAKQSGVIDSLIRLITVQLKVENLKSVPTPAACDDQGQE